uniref:Ac66 n=1 Tax=Lymantria dispar multicapsid nuclear polyhedrosis virus TaxID=10449 RepID=A0A140HQV4_NPVLD|nr:desmoplakin [Lymantria dispar multiple nucleopolyhedrovirus]QDE14937.1 ac66 [Lymantria dispar multiple nucleopolyhedrovirus]
MRVMRAVSAGPMETRALPASRPACSWVFNADHSIRFTDDILDIMASYRYRAPTRYINADVSVDNLLRTIDSMSRQCRSRNETESELARVRSIITLYRPHLQNRVDLQVAELVLEALMPPAGAQQITHNFNYKYDYNTNSAAAPPPPFFPVAPARPTDAFGAPIAPSEPTPAAPPTKADAPNPIQQNVYINSAGEAARPSSPTPRPPPPPPPASGGGAVALMQVDDADELALKNDYDTLTREYTLVSYKRLVRTLVAVSQKYIINDLFVRGLAKLCSVELLLNNDLGALVDCINREAALNIRPDTPDLCRLLVAMIRGFFMLASSATRQEYTLARCDSAALVEEEVWSVKTALDQRMSRLADELETARDQLTQTASRLNRAELELRESRETTLMLKRQVEMNEALRRPARFDDELAQSRDQSLELDRERRRVRDFEVELDRAQRDLESVAARHSDELGRARRELESERERHASELARARRELREQHDNDIEQLRLEADTARRSEAGASRQQAEGTVANLNTRLKAQSELNRDLQAKAEAQADANARLQAEIDSLKRAESDAVDLRNRVAQLEAEAESGAADLQNRIARLEAESSDLTRRLQESTAEALALRRDKEDLERRTAASAAQDVSYGRLQEDIARVKADLSRLTDSSDGVQFDILKLNNLRDEALRDRLQQLQTENDRLREDSELEIILQAESINDEFDQIKRTIDEFKSKQRRYEKSEKDYVQKYELLARAVTRDKLNAELVPQEVQSEFQNTAFSMVSSTDDII